MWRALFKKELLELNAFYFMDRRTGKRRSLAGILRFAALFLGLLVLLGVSVYSMAAPLAMVLLPAGLGWMYFAAMSLITVLLGVFGSVFNTYSTLYHARDNELLLSMPIPPRRILLVRMAGIYCMGLLYQLVVYVPTLIGFFRYGRVTAGAAASAVLVGLLLGFLVLTLSCVLGWFVAVLSSRLKKKYKSLVSVVAALGFVALYYVGVFRFSNALEEMLLDVLTTGELVRGRAYPLYLLGSAAMGDGPALLVTAAVLLGAAGLTYAVLSRTFLSLATRSENTEKAVYREKPLRTSGVQAALLRREWQRFASSATYMLNCALSTVFMPIAAVLLLLFPERVRLVLAALSLPPELTPVLVSAMVFASASMNDTTVPSVSLEGKNLWIAQSLPVTAAQVLEAKVRLQVCLTAVPALLLTICAGLALDCGTGELSLLLMLTMMYVRVSAQLGLLLGLLHPSLTWTNETAPIKQSFSVMVYLLGGMAASFLYGVGGYYALRFVPAKAYLAVVLVLLLVLYRWLCRWVQTTGAARYAAL